MALLKQEITTRGIQGGIADPSEAPIQELDPVTLLEIQAMFGQLLVESPRLMAFINRLGPVLFATCLFSCMEGYEVNPDNEDEVIATRDVFEAELEAIGMVRSVAAAMGKLSGDVAVTPSDREVDEDTDITGVQPD